MIFKLRYSGLLLILSLSLYSWAIAQDTSVSAIRVEKESISIQKYCGVQIPLAALSIGVGSSSFVSSSMFRGRSFVREEVQLWRRQTMNDKLLSFDNYIQYLPAVTALILNVSGIQSVHEFNSLSCRLIMSYGLVAATVNPLKYAIRSPRPNLANSRSFPSGHTAFAFAGAEVLRLEYSQVSPWIPIAGFSVALLTGFMRIYNDCHWFTDVLAGAGIGLLCVDLSYWLNDLIFK